MTRLASSRTVIEVTVSAMALVVASVGFARSAHAELRPDGSWRQGPLREDLTVQQWLAGCGPAPQSSSSGGGEIITVRAEGDELAFVGGGRVFRTNQCYETMPTLARESHSRDPSGRSWRTRCATPASDPRRAILNTLVVATTDTQIDIVETGRYEITLENGRCMADIRRTRTLTRIADEAPVTSEAPAPPPLKKPDPKPEPKPEPKAACDPGPPSKLEVRPSKKLLRTGEAFQFRASVMDEKGCATATATAWQLAPGQESRGVTVDASGKVTVGADAPEGSVEIVATAGGKSTRVVVDVSQPAHYDDLLVRSGLNASGENDAASSVAIGSQSMGAEAGKVEDRARGRRLAFLGIVGGVLAALAVLAVVMVRRAKKASALRREAEERHEARVQEVLKRREQRAEKHAERLKEHEQSVAAAEAARQRAAAAARAPRPAPPVSGSGPSNPAEKICATCGRRFADAALFCPNDGSRLDPASDHHASSTAIPYPAPAAMAARGPASIRRGKICPTCGERFDGGADFCGKDGTQLVLLN